MPSKLQVEQAINNHIQYWNGGHRQQWINNFSEDVVFHDPVGAKPKYGREAATASWDNSFSNEQQWTLELTRLIVCDDEAAITLNNHGVVKGQPFTMEGIEVWKVDDDGRVCQVRAYFDAPSDIELDPYFQRDRKD